MDERNERKTKKQKETNKTYEVSEWCFVKAHSAHVLTRRPYPPPANLDLQPSVTCGDLQSCSRGAELPCHWRDLTDD